MTSYNPNRPVQTESPGLFPPQNSANFTRLKTIISGDHVFNDAAAATDGYHDRVSMIGKGTLQNPIPAAIPPLANGVLYCKLGAGFVFSTPWWYNGYHLPLSPVLAMVNFDGTGPIANPINPSLIRSSLNVGSVTKLATGRFRIDFSPAMPNDKYIVQVTGMPNSSGLMIVGMVRGNTSYSAIVTAASVQISFNDQTNTAVDPIMANVVITGVPL